MVRTGTAPAAAAPSTSKYAKAPKATKPKTAPTHPPVASLVTTAISALNEKGGSSLSAIKKHISANNNVDVKRLAPFIRRFLVSAVGKGTLIQVKGKGASGSFKLNKAVKKEAKPKVTKKPKSDKPKKAAGEKEVKQVIVPKEPKEVKPKAAEPVKAPVEKPEATKPAKSVKKAVPKKAAPKKAPAKK